MKWQKKLTKKEIQHFRYATDGVATLEAFMESREKQRNMDMGKEVCWECRSIALKLGMEK